MKKGDIVVMENTPLIYGEVLRIGKQGWADVEWHQATTGARWRKRQPDTAKLTLLEGL